MKLNMARQLEQEELSEEEVIDFYEGLIFLKKDTLKFEAQEGPPGEEAEPEAEEEEEPAAEEAAGEEPATEEPAAEEATAVEASGEESVIPEVPIEDPSGQITNEEITPCEETAAGEPVIVEAVAEEGSGQVTLNEVAEEARLAGTTESETPTRPFEEPIEQSNEKEPHNAAIITEEAGETVEEL